MDIILCGHSGKMAQSMLKICECDNRHKIVAIITSQKNVNNTTLTYNDIFDFKGRADVVMDLSLPDVLDDILSYCMHTATPAVICSTGHSEIQLKYIKKVSKTVPILKSANMSLGISIINLFAEFLTSKLNEHYFDIDIIEKHHSKKLDSPSGTALTLRDIIKHNFINHVVPIHSIRAGNIVGEHSILYTGLFETIELKHTVSSREAFVKGALKAAKFIQNKEPDLYSIQDILKS